MRNPLKLLLLMACWTVWPAMADTNDVQWLSKVYDYGLIMEADGPKDGRLGFVNRSDHAVTVIGVRPGCGCTTADYPQEPVAPGDTAYISFQYDPNGRPGHFEKSIRVYLGTRDTHRLTIKGNVLGEARSLANLYPYGATPLLLTDTELFAGDIVYGENHTYFVSGYNNTTDSISPAIAQIPEGLGASASASRIGPGDLVTFALYLNTQDMPDTGQVHLPMTIIADTSADSVQTHTVTLHANVVPDPSITPEALAKSPVCEFATTTIGIGRVADRPVSFTADVANAGADILTLYGFKSADGLISLKKIPSRIKPGKTGTITLELNAGALPPGPFELKCDFRTNDPLRPLRRLTIIGNKTQFP